MSNKATCPLCHVEFIALRLTPSLPYCSANCKIRVAERAQRFLHQSNEIGGRIVSSGDLTPLQIAEAQACKRFYVDPATGLGWAIVPWGCGTAKDAEREACNQKKADDEAKQPPDTYPENPRQPLPTPPDCMDRFAAMRGSILLMLGRLRAMETVFIENNLTTAAELADRSAAIYRQMREACQADNG